MRRRKPRSIEQQIFERLSVAKTKGCGARLTNEMVEHIMATPSKFLHDAEKVKEITKYKKRAEAIKRTKEREKAWRAEHKALGRPLTNHMVRDIQSMRAEGLTYKTIAAKLQISEATAQFWGRSEEDREAIRRKYSQKKSRQYHGDPEFRQRVLAYQHERYANEKHIIKARKIAKAKEESGCSEKLSQHSPSS